MQYDTLNSSNLLLVHFPANAGAIAYMIAMAHHPAVILNNPHFITFVDGNEQTFENFAIDKKLELFARIISGSGTPQLDDTNKNFWGFSIRQILGLESEGSDYFNPGSLELLTDYKCMIHNNDISSNVISQAGTLLSNAKQIFLTTPKMGFDSTALGLDNNPNVHVVDLFNVISSFEPVTVVDSAKSTLTWLGLDSSQIDSSVTTTISSFFSNLKITKEDYIANNS